MKLITVIASACALTLLGCWLGVRYLWDAKPPYVWLCNCPGNNPAAKIMIHKTRAECRGKSLQP